jgi:AraC-like DNA-binding protein
MPNALKNAKSADQNSSVIRNRVQLPSGYRERLFSAFDPRIQYLNDKGLMSCGINNTPAGYYNAHAHTQHHSFVVPCRGRIHMRVGNEDRMFRNGSAIFVPSHVPHCCQVLHGKAEFRWFAMARLPGKGALPADSVSFGTTSQYLVMRQVLEIILTELSFEPSPDSCKTILHASQLLVHCIDIVADSITGNRQDPLAENLSEAWLKIAQNLCSSWTLDAIAKMTCLSKRHLNRICLERYQKTPMQKVVELRINHAKELLLHTRYKFNAIASQIGYANEFAFCVAFKRTTGLSPLLFKKRFGYQNHL